MKEWKAIIDTAPGVAREEYYCGEWDTFEKSLKELLRRAEGIVLLVDNNGDYMLFGVEGEVACIQFCPCDPADTPREKLRSVLWGAGDNLQDDSFVEFNLGGTGTVINSGNCLSPSLLIPVAKEFFITRKLSNLVAWIPE